MSPSLTDISCLPEEILHQIFSLLPPRTVLTSVVEVCLRWRSVVECNTRFWNNLQLVIDCDLFINRRCLEPLSFATLEPEPILIGEKDLTTVSKVRSIKFINGIKAKSDPALLLVRVLDITRKVCRSIERVECSHSFGATSVHFVQFLSECYTNINEIVFGLNCLYRIPYQEFVRFEHLGTVVSHDYAFRRSDLYCLADDCHKLVRLWIIFSRAVTNDDVIYFLEKKKEQLKELGIGNSVKDSVLEKLKECQKLSVLFIGDARWISGDGLAHLTNVPLLKYFSLHRLKLPADTLTAWVTSSTIPPQLKILDLTDYYLKQEEERFKVIFQIGKVCPITFCNSVNIAITRPHPLATPRVHWMYYRVV